MIKYKDWLEATVNKKHLLWEPEELEKNKMRNYLVNQYIGHRMSYDDLQSKLKELGLSAYTQPKPSEEQPNMNDLNQGVEALKMLQNLQDESIPENKKINFLMGFIKNHKWNPKMIQALKMYAEKNPSMLTHPEIGPLLASIKL